MTHEQARETIYELGIYNLETGRNEVTKPVSRDDALMQVARARSDRPHESIVLSTVVVFLMIIAIIAIVPAIRSYVIDGILAPVWFMIVLGVNLLATALF